MPFSGRAREELARIVPGRACCRRAELAGMAQTLAHAGDLELVVGSAAVARKAFRLARTMVPVRPRLTADRHGRKAHRYRVAVTGFPGIVDYDEHGLPSRRCCRRAYVRGAFVAHGSITDPDRTYHLEIQIEQAEVAAGLVRLLAQLGVTASLSPKRRAFVVYVKDGEQIGEFLRLVKAHQALLVWENVRIVKGMKNRVNRLVNAETANMDKTVAASLHQLAGIAYLAGKMGVEFLPLRLRAIARARLAMPYASLAELGESLEPPLTKSAANYRLRKLLAMAGELGFGSEPPATDGSEAKS